MVREQALPQVQREHRLDGTQIDFWLIGIVIASFGRRLGLVDALVDQPLDPLLLLGVPLANQIGKELAEVEIADQVGTLKFVVADGAFVLSIDDFTDAVLAERVPTLGDVRVIERLEADDALSELSDYFIDTDLNCLIVLRLLPPTKAWLLKHLHIRHVFITAGQVQIVEVYHF